MTSIIEGFVGQTMINTFGPPEGQMRRLREPHIATTEAFAVVVRDVVYVPSEHPLGGSDRRGHREGDDP